MKHYEIARDFALLDRGVDRKEGEPPFIIIVGSIEVDNNGRPSGKSIGLARRVLSNDAVKDGATRINESDCVDVSEGGIEASDDMIIYFNGGEVYEKIDTDQLLKAIGDYTAEEKKRATKYIKHIEDRQNFLVEQGMFIPTEKTGRRVLVEEAEKAIKVIN